ncbi:MAG: hypothetical protein FJ264_16905 [Planctomycetes bacterium]|nr:hypothetical protein [Planctomycetota bacterium]
MNTPKSTPEENEYYKEILEALVRDNKKLREIEKLDMKKPILLIGKDKDLIQTAISWIHLSHPKSNRPVVNTPSLFERYVDNWKEYLPVKNSAVSGRIILTEYSCIGKTETEIERDLFNSLSSSLMTNYTRGEMLFVRGLNSKRMLERLADSYLMYCPGVMIINVPSINIVPQGLLEEFEIIELEPEKQGTPASTPQTKGNVFRCNGDVWEITLKDDHLQVKDRLYMKHIQYVLENPLKRLSLLELDRVFEGKQQTNTTEEQQKECMDILSVSGNLGTIEKQDNRDSKEYLNKKIKELKDSIEIAKETRNSEMEAESQAELDELSKHLSNGEYKIMTSNRKGKNEASILKGINRCIDNIKDAANKANTGKLIAEHIDKNIERLNYHIIYRPENQPNWNL